MPNAEAAYDPNRELAHELARWLPCCGDEDDTDSDSKSDLISLCDIVITAMDHNEFTHFRTRFYEPKNTGQKGSPWAIVEALPSSGAVRRPVFLDLASIRKAVEDYAYSRLSRGMDWKEVQRLVDGSYTDLQVADSIVQFAIYGEEVYG